MLAAIPAILKNKKNQKRLGYAVLGGIALVILYWGYRRLKEFFAIKRAEDRLTDCGNVTLTEARAIALADRLEATMNGIDTAEAQVIDTLQSLETPGDFCLLVRTFGVRENCHFLGFGCTDGNLIDWLQMEFYGVIGGYNSTFGYLGGSYWQEQLETELQRLGFAFDEE